MSEIFKKPKERKERKKERSPKKEKTGKDSKGSSSPSTQSATPLSESNSLSSDRLKESGSQSSTETSLNVVKSNSTDVNTVKEAAAGTNEADDSSLFETAESSSKSQGLKQFTKSLSFREDSPIISKKEKKRPVVSNKQWSSDPNSARSVSLMSTSRAPKRISAKTEDLKKGNRKSGNVSLNQKLSQIQMEFPPPQPSPVRGITNPELKWSSEPERKVGGGGAGAWMLPRAGLRKSEDLQKAVEPVPRPGEDVFGLLILDGKELRTHDYKPQLPSSPTPQADQGKGRFPLPSRPSIRRVAAVSEGLAVMTITKKKGRMEEDPSESD